MKNFVELYQLWKEIEEAFGHRRWTAKKEGLIDQLSKVVSALGEHFVGQEAAH